MTLPVSTFSAANSGVVAVAVVVVGHRAATAGREAEPEPRLEHMGHLRQRDAQVRVQFHDQGDDLGAELHAGSPQRIGGLQRVPPRNTAPTLRAVADLEVEKAHDGTHHREVFLVLRCHARHLDRAAAVGTRRRGRCRVVLVDLRGTGAAGLPPIGRAGSPAGSPAAPLRPLLGEGSRLPASGPAHGRQLLLEMVDLLLQAVVLTSGPPSIHP